MDAFEQLVSEILWQEGHWVHTSVKVNLTKEEKRLIGRPSSPRWELDVVAYSGKENTLYAVECKSYLDSRGVVLQAFDGRNELQANRYKLFNDANLRSVVLNRLQQQLSGTCKVLVPNQRPRSRNPNSRQGFGQLFDKLVRIIRALSSIHRVLSI